MQDPTVQGEVTITGRPRNLKEVLRVLKRQRGSIFFEKNLAMTNAQNLHNSKTCLTIPGWFFDRHGDQFRDIVHLVVGPTTRTWAMRFYIPRANYINEHKGCQVKLCQGWNEFATFHGLVKNDRLIFSLKAMSTFEVYIFHKMGEPKESSFSTSREDIHRLLPKKGYEKLEAKRLEGKGMTIVQLGKDLVRKYIYLNAKRNKDIIHVEKPLDSALDIFEPNGIPEINGEVGDGASSTLSILQSNSSAVVQSTLFVLGQSDVAIALPFDPLTIVGSDPPALVHPKIEGLVK